MFILHYIISLYFTWQYLLYLKHYHTEYMLSISIVIANNFKVFHLYIQLLSHDNLIYEESLQACEYLTIAEILGLIWIRLLKVQDNALCTQC